jgi:hypothetical protein
VSEKEENSIIQKAAIQETETFTRPMRNTYENNATAPSYTSR